MKVEHVSAAELFITTEFRYSSWIKDLCGRVGKTWVTREPLPPGHFGTYFGATQVREYENPYISDLYWLHELTHVVTLTYDPDRSWLAWSRAMIESELEASLTSECYAYLHIPGLRAKTFKHEIWVDRFLHLDPSDSQIGRTTLFDHIRAERLRALHAPAFNDFLEAQLANYYRQNHEWCRIWADPARTGPEISTPAFRIVEEHMSAPNRDVFHQEWIEKHATRDGGWQAPFVSQALAFTDVYEASNAKFGNWLLIR